MRWQARRPGKIGLEREHAHGLERADVPLLRARPRSGGSGPSRSTRSRTWRSWWRRQQRCWRGGGSRWPIAGRPSSPSSCWSASSASAASCSTPSPRAGPPSPIPPRIGDGSPARGEGVEQEAADADDEDQQRRGQSSVGLGDRPPVVACRCQLSKAAAAATRKATFEIALSGSPQNRASSPRSQ